MQTGHAAVLLLLLLAACCVAGQSDQAVMQDATAFDSRPAPTPPFDGLTMTCFKLCQLGGLSEAAVPAAAHEQTAAADHPSTAPSGTQQPSQQPAGSGGSSASPAGQSASVSSAPGSTRRLLAGTVNSTANSTANSTSSSSAPSTSLAAVTSCAGLDPEAVALLRSRIRAFRTRLVLSDFFEIFYSIGNLWSSINDLLRQALSSFVQGKVVVTPESILLFNANIAGITAFWGNLVQNILLLKADLILPLPDEVVEGPSSG